MLQGRIPLLEEIPLLDDWVFIGDCNLLTVQSNDLYHKLTTQYGWLEDKVTRRWGFSRLLTWWPGV